MIIIILGLLCIFGGLAWFFRANEHKNPLIARAARVCPCSRLARTGALSKLLTYSAIGVIIVDCCAMQFVPLSEQQIAELALCAVLLWLGFKVAKE